MPCNESLNAHSSTDTVLTFFVLLFAVAVAPLVCAGQNTLLNPVEPKFRPGYTPGQLQLPSHKAAVAMRAAAAAAGVSEAVLSGIKLHTGRMSWS